MREVSYAGAVRVLRGMLGFVDLGEFANHLRETSARFVSELPLLYRVGAESDIHKIHTPPPVTE